MFAIYATPYTYPAPFAPSDVYRFSLSQRLIKRNRFYCTRPARSADNATLSEGPFVRISSRVPSAFPTPEMVIRLEEDASLDGRIVSTTQRDRKIEQASRIMLLQLFSYYIILRICFFLFIISYYLLEFTFSRRYCSFHILENVFSHSCGLLLLPKFLFLLFFTSLTLDLSFFYSDNSIYSFASLVFRILFYFSLT